MRILIVTHYFLPHIGGIEVVAYNQAKELVKRGHEVTIVTSALSGDNAVEHHNGIRVVRVPAWNWFEKKFEVPYPLFSPRVISTLHREVKSNDIIHVHGVLYPGSFLSSLLAKVHKKPLFVTEHVGFVKYKSSILNAIEKLALRTVGSMTLWASDAAIVLNPSVHEWVKQSKDEVYYLANGVDQELFSKPTAQEKQAVRKQFNLPLDTFIALFVGRFVAKKGIDVLYAARDSSYLLVLAGGGAIPDYLTSNESMRVIGSLPQEDLARLYKASDVFVLPSHGEGFPLSIQEAMISGLPIITSKHNNLDQIRDSPCISYIDVTPQDITLAIKKIQNDTALRATMSEYSTQIARENYSWERNGAELLAIYGKKALSNNERELRTVYATTGYDSELH